MKRNIPIKLLSCLLTAVMLFTTCSVAATAAANNDKGKYLKDVFIAYGADKEKAVEWLTNNGWELTLGNITLDGGNYSCSETGAILRVVGNGKATLDAGAVLQKPFIIKYD